MWGQTFHTLTPTLQTLTLVPLGFLKPLLNTTHFQWGPLNWPNRSFTCCYPYLLAIMVCAATSRANKAEKPHIPEINWSVNNSAAVWTLLAKIEKSKNFCILYGKKDVAEVSFPIPSSCGCLTWPVHRIQVVKRMLLCMPGLPKLSSQNCFLLKAWQG